MKRFLRPTIVAAFWSLVSACLLTNIKLTATFVDEPPQEFWGFPFPWLSDNIALSLSLSIHMGLFLLNLLILFAVCMLAIRFVRLRMKGRTGRLAARGGTLIAVLYLVSFGMLLSFHDKHFTFTEGMDDWFFFSHSSLIGYAYSIGLP